MANVIICSDARTLQGLQLWFGTNCHYVLVQLHPLASRGRQTFHAAGESKLLQLFIPYTHFKVFIYHSKVMICLPMGLLKAKHFYELAYPVLHQLVPAMCLDSIRFKTSVNKRPDIHKRGLAVKISLVPVWIGITLN